MKYLMLFENYHTNLLEWFGDSKIVDKNGKPLVMYHGSPHINKIKKFKSSKGGFMYFTSSLSEAERYTDVIYSNDGSYAKEVNKRIGKFYIRAEKPFDSFNLSKSDKDKLYEIFTSNVDELFKLVDDYESLYDYFEYKYDDGDREKDNMSLKEKVDYLMHYIQTGIDNYLLIENHKIQDFIKSNGYDSFYTIESGDGLNVAVYDNSQIKSVNNNGEFKEDGNIFESLKSDASGYQIGEYIYHVTPKSNEDKIKNNGFTPKDGVSINGESFENRLYFATSLISAYDLSVNFQAHGRGDEYIIYKLNSNCIDSYEEDILFPHGIYVDYKIPYTCVVDIIDADDLFDEFDEDDLENLYL